MRIEQHAVAARASGVLLIGEAAVGIGTHIS